MTNHTLPDNEDRDVGFMGESMLEHWAGEGGFVANKTKAGADKGGWDFYIQFKRSPGTDGVTDSLDHLLGALECLVQVKATDTGNTHEVKLSNWHRLCSSPLPAFFLIFDYRGGSTPQSAYLVHVDKKWIGKTLKKLRGLSRESREELHHHTMRVSWGPRDRLPEVTARSFKATLAERIGKNLMAYGRKKAKWLDEVGYDVPAARLTFSLEGDAGHHPEDLLIDFALGVRDRLDVQASEFEEIRFGIAQPIPNSGRLQLRGKPKPSGTAKLTFTTHTRTARFRCKYFTPAGVAEAISKERFRVRYVSSFVEFMMHAKTGAMDFKFSSPKPRDLVPLDELAHSFELLNILAESLQSQEPLPDLNLMIEHEDQAYELIFKAPRIPHIAEIDRNLAKAVGDAWYISKKLELDPESKVSLAIIGSNASTLEACRAILDDAPHDIRISGELTPAEVATETSIIIPDTGEIEFGLPLVVAVPIGKALVVAVAAAHGKPELNPPLEDGVVTYSLTPRLHRFPPTVIRHFTGGNYSLKEHFARASDWMKERGISIPDPLVKQLATSEATE